MCVCVCEKERVRERVRKREYETIYYIDLNLGCINERIFLSQIFSAEHYDSSSAYYANLCVCLWGCVCVCLNMKQYIAMLILIWIVSNKEFFFNENISGDRYDSSSAYYAN